MATLADTFCAHWHNQQGVAPNPLLWVHVFRIQNILTFLDA